MILLEARMTRTFRIPKKIAEVWNENKSKSENENKLRDKTNILQISRHATPANSGATTLCASLRGGAATDTRWE